MNQNFLGKWFVSVGFAALFGLMTSCSSNPDRIITPEEAKEMILCFLSSQEASNLGSWVINNRGLVEKDNPSRMPSGSIIIGPWVVDPGRGSVNITIDRAELNGSFSKKKGRT
jgi:hypothetical protein